MTEENFALVDSEMVSNLAESCQISASPGTFSLRRTRYFTAPPQPVLSDNQERMLIKQAWAGDFKARRSIVACHMHLVVDFAKRYANRGLPLLDLVREGTLGIVQTLEKFDHEDGSSFSTCAARRIHHNIECAILNRKKTPVASHTTPETYFQKHYSATRNGENDVRAA